MVLINQTSICFLKFIQLPNSILAASKTQNSWLEMVFLARNDYEYEEPDFEIICHPDYLRAKNAILPDYQLPTFTYTPKRKTRCHPR